MGKKKTGVFKNCERCGEEFYVQAYRAGESKFCSMACTWIGRPKRKPKEVQATCGHCGKSYFVRAYRKDKTTFCSRRCGGLAHRAARDLAMLEAVKASRSEMKTCIKCGLEKPFSEFYRRPNSPDGHRHNCKTCCRNNDLAWLARDGNRDRKVQADQDYYTANKEEIAAGNAERYAANKDDIIARNKKWRRENAEELSAYNRRRRGENVDEFRARRRADYRKNKGRYVAQARAREELIKRATPPWADLKAIEQFYVEAERLTRETGIPHHVDHFYPLQGKTMCGLHVEANLRVMTAVANLRKSNRIVEEVGGAMLGL